ncbi:MAG: RDD family protein [Actinomycetes bacterium]
MTEHENGTGHGRTPTEPAPWPPPSWPPPSWDPPSWDPEPRAWDPESRESTQSHADDSRPAYPPPGFPPDWGHGATTAAPSAYAERSPRYGFPDEPFATGPTDPGIPTAAYAATAVQQPTAATELGRVTALDNAALASWGARARGALVDAGVTLLPAGVLVATGLAVAGSGSAGAGLVWMTCGYAVLLGTGLWNHVLRQGVTGRTVGKSVVGLVLVRRDTRQAVGPGTAFARSAAHVLDTLPLCLGWLMPLVDGRRRTVADRLCDTLVVRSDRPPLGPPPADAAPRADHRPG